MTIALVLLPNLRFIKLLNIFTEYVPTIKTTAGYIHYPSTSDTSEWKLNNKTIYKASKGSIMFPTTKIVVHRKILVF